MILNELSQSAMVQNLQAGRFDKASQAMPRTIREIVVGNEPPVSQLSMVVPMSQIAAQLEFELIKANDLVSVGNRLSTTQVEFVAGALLEAFPNETIADFKIACQRGCIGQYGEIFRLDGIVIRGWVEKYLEEKYQLVETESMKAKAKREGTRAKPSTVLPTEKVGISDAGIKALEDMQKIVDETKKQSKVPGMTDAEIRKNGQEKPPKKSSLTSGETTFFVLGFGQNATTRKEAKVRVRKLIKGGHLDFGISLNAKREGNED